MWEYNYTPRPDELYHWKYIKRYKKNGKWRYVYDKKKLKEDLGYGARDNYKALKQESDLARLKTTAARVNVMSAVSRLKPTKNPGASRQAKYYREAMNEYKKLSDQYERAEYRTELALQTYYKTPMGRIQQVKDIGKKIADKILSILPKKKKDNSGNIVIEHLVSKPIIK